MNTKGHCYPKSIILQAVYFKLRFTLSYRDVEEIMKIRGVIVGHATIQRWVCKLNLFLKVFLGAFPAIRCNLLCRTPAQKDFTAIWARAAGEPWFLTNKNKNVI